MSLVLPKVEQVREVNTPTVEPTHNVIIDDDRVYNKLIEEARDSLSRVEQNITTMNNNIFILERTKMLETDELKKKLIQNEITYYTTILNLNHQRRKKLRSLLFDEYEPSPQVKIEDKNPKEEMYVKIIQKLATQPPASDGDRIMKAFIKR